MVKNCVLAAFCVAALASVCTSASSLEAHAEKNGEESANNQNPPHLIKHHSHSHNHRRRRVPSDVELSRDPMYKPLWEDYLGRQQAKALGGSGASSSSTVADSGGAFSLPTVEPPAVLRVPAAPYRPDVGPDAKVTFLPAAGTTVRLAVIGNPITHWHFYSPAARDASNHSSTCAGNGETVSASAEIFNCDIAANAGPFSPTPVVNNNTYKECVGPLVSDGIIRQGLSSDPKLKKLPMIGLTKSHPNANGAAAAEWVFGTDLTNDDLDGMKQLVGGMAWAVYNGKPTTNTVNGTLVAPRTIVGVDKEGRAMLAVADGAETARVGMTMLQAAQWAISAGMVHAITLDGGGSSTFWWNGNVANGARGVQGCPTGIDAPVCVERTVITIVCIK